MHALDGRNDGMGGIPDTQQKEGQNSSHSGDDTPTLWVLRQTVRTHSIRELSGADGRQHKKEGSRNEPNRKARILFHAQMQQKAG